MTSTASARRANPATFGLLAPAVRELREHLSRRALRGVIEDAPPTPFLGHVTQETILLVCDALVLVHGAGRDAARPYIARARRTLQIVQKAEADGVSARFHVEDVVLAVAWAHSASMTVRGFIDREAFEQAQADDEDFGVFLALSGDTPPRDVRHPEVVHPRADGAFAWEGWAREVVRPDYLSRAAKQLAPMIAWYADRDGVCFPSVRMLCLDSGMTNPGVIGALRELEDGLALEVVERGRGRRRTTYRLLPQQTGPSPRTSQDPAHGLAPVPF